MPVAMSRRRASEPKRTGVDPRTDPGEQDRQERARDQHRDRGHNQSPHTDGPDLAHAHHEHRGESDGDRRARHQDRASAVPGRLNHRFRPRQSLIDTIPVAAHDQERVVDAQPKPHHADNADDDER